MKKNFRIMKKSIFVIVFTFLLILFSNLYYVSFDENFYSERVSEKEFSKVLDYLKNGNEIRGEYFNSKEKLHLEDVKSLFDIVKVLIILSLMVLVFGYWYLRKKIFLNSVKIGCLVLLGFVLVLLLLSLFDFNWLFLKFHEIVFTNDLWLLDPSTDNLIKLLPEEVFFDILKRLIINVVVSSLVVIILVRRRLLNF